MEGASILGLIAELAIALLGFSGIVVAIGERGQGVLNPVERSRFFTMVLMGALAEVLALLPFALYHTGLASDTLWGWTSGAAAAIALVMNRMLMSATPGATLRIIWSDPTVSKVALVSRYSF